MPKSSGFRTPEQPPKQRDDAGGSGERCADEVRRHARPARTAARLDRRSHIGGPVEDRQSPAGRSLQHSSSLGLVSAYLAVHENQRYVKLQERWPFPWLVSGE
jgi:hypothetical protein